MGVNRVTFRSVQFGSPGAGVGPGGGCLARIVGVLVLLIMVVAIAVGIIVIPIVAAVSYFLTAAWFKLFGPKRTTTVVDGVVVERLSPTQCVKCGADLRRAAGPQGRGACPECGTLFGFDVEVRHNDEAPAALPPVPVQPADRADR